MPAPIIRTDTIFDTDATIVFSDDPRQRDSAWLTVDTGDPARPKYSVNIINTRNGVKIDLFFLNQEMEDPAIGGLLLDYEYQEITGEPFEPEAAS